MRSIFLNLPVSDLAASRTFWAELGFSFNPEYSDESCACMVIDSNIFAMLLVEQRFRDFITSDIADSFATKEVLTCLTAESRQEVDELVRKAVSNGGKPWKPAFEHGPMYGGSFQDPDGHVWELMSMDSRSSVPQ